jgi:hypothetical protein
MRAEVSRGLIRVKTVSALLVHVEIFPMHASERKWWTTMRTHIALPLLPLNRRNVLMSGGALLAATSSPYAERKSEMR